jgi:hypothetical protein
MKWFIVLLAVPVSAVACPKGSFEYNGECAVDIQPITAEAVKPSDEKPPSDKMPSYQREGIKVIDAPNMAFEDAKADQDKRDADLDGKKAAGIQ